MIKSYLNIRLAIGVVLGAIAGYAYYYFIGCSSGSCGITSDPLNSTLYGTMVGVLLFLKKTDPSSKQDERNQENDSQ